MRSRVEIAVEAEASGRTRFTRLAAEGGLAVRRTSPVGVHLIGTAAGPIGDDAIEVSVVVGRGAHLEIRAVAATICLPGTDSAASRLLMTVMLHSEASLDCTMPSLIVCRGSRVITTTEIAAEASSRLILDERVSLGRSGEASGDWASRILVDVGGRPALRQTQSSRSILDAISRLHGAPAISGAATSRLELGPGVEMAPHLTTSGGSMSLQLAVPGRLTTSVGTDLLSARRHTDALVSASTE